MLHHLKKSFWVLSLRLNVNFVGSTLVDKDAKTHQPKIEIMPEQDSSEPIAVANADIVISPETLNQSKPFVGQWNELVSTTNWDKGEIIIQWRESLKEKSASASESSDEAWSQLVGGVTPQHVGRLRRTFERFGHTFKEYQGIYWSHFYAALDWDDAEMWLEGAVQSKWSVSGLSLIHI